MHGDITMTKGREEEKKSSDSSQVQINRGFELMLRSLSTKPKDVVNPWFQIKFGKLLPWFRKKKVDLFFEFRITFK